MTRKACHHYEPLQVQRIRQALSMACTPPARASKLDSSAGRQPGPVSASTFRQGQGMASASSPAGGAASPGSNTGLIAACGSQAAAVCTPPSSPPHKVQGSALRGGGQTAGGAAAKSAAPHAPRKGCERPRKSLLERGAGQVPPSAGPTGATATLRAGVRAPVPSAAEASKAARPASRQGSCVGYPGTGSAGNGSFARHSTKAAAGSSAGSFVSPRASSSSRFAAALSSDTCIVSPRQRRPSDLGGIPLTKSSPSASSTSAVGPATGRLAGLMQADGALSPRDAWHSLTAEPSGAQSRHGVRNPTSQQQHRHSLSPTRSSGSTAMPASQKAGCDCRVCWHRRRVLPAFHEVRDSVWVYTVLVHWFQTRCLCGCTELLLQFGVDCLANVGRSFPCLRPTSAFRQVHRLHLQARLGLHCCQTAARPHRPLQCLQRRRRGKGKEGSATAIRRRGS
eukprot:TRINITY_DN9088_c0_g1_i13.p1 TRINITY_DN9088_c0_g1~~TRINITY_DN9088_c0_g1_i13.p1  ORF type:complete len:452 (+),score=37.90 TRINITY_DN9088_c0_g1_i13:513-1868(+)